MVKTYHTKDDLEFVIGKLKELFNESSDGREALKQSCENYIDSFMDLSLTMQEQFPFKQAFFNALKTALMQEKSEKKAEGLTKKIVGVISWHIRISGEENRTDRDRIHTAHNLKVTLGLV